MVDISGLKVGNILTLKDPQTVKEWGEEGSDFIVDNIYTAKFKDSNNRDIVNYTFIHIHNDDVELVVALVSNGKNQFIRVYGTLEDISERSRQDIIDDVGPFLFLQPEQEEFVAGDLELAPYITLPDDELEEFSLSGFKQTLYGIIDGVNCPVAVQLTEYSSNAKTENPDLLVLEEGYISDEDEVLDDGGYVTLMIGCEISPEDLII